MSWFKRSKARRPASTDDAGPPFGEVPSIAGVELRMPAQEVLRALGEPVNRASAESIWGQASAVIFKHPDAVEAWLYDLVELDRSLMVILENGRVRTLHLQRLR